MENDLARVLLVLFYRFRTQIANKFIARKRMRYSQLLIQAVEFAKNDLMLSHLEHGLF